MKCPKGFTLIELLVVVAVIALLISIMIPSLGRARAQAKAIKCGAQINSVGKAVASYLAENNATYPPSYWYPNGDGSYDFMHQNPAHPAGYAHWSSFLFNNVKNLKAFTCPEFENGGLSRTNPGPNGGYWTSGQTDQNDNSNPGGAVVEDHQAPFMAFTGNAAVLARNKFTADVAAADGGSGQRLNVFVRQTTIAHESTVILMTEFNNNWHATTAINASTNALVIKSHRPLNPFIGAGGGTDEYTLSTRDFFAYPGVSDLYDSATLATRIAGGSSMATDNQTQLNDVGRHHPGSYSYQGRNYGGSANFLYIDGHVERKNVAQTIINREWGDAYYSLNGDNHVMN